MIKCKNSCPLDKFDGCCFECDIKTNCKESCMLDPTNCENATIIEKISEEIRPSKEEIYYKRLFNNSYWELVDDNDSYEIQEKKLLEKQKNAVNKLLKSGIEKVINFAKNYNL